MIREYAQLKIVPQYAEDAVCCFTGNRPGKLPWGNSESDERCKSIKAAIREALLEQIKKGKKLFISGMALGGDTYFAEEVLALRDEGYGICLECAIPCENQTYSWGAFDRARYERILDRADFVTVLQPHYTRYCMMARNRYMVNKSAAIITLIRDGDGGSAATFAMAKKKKLEIIEI